jgi:putative flippase GtrA
MPTLEHPREDQREEDEAVDRLADRTWAVVRRIHLGTRKPANWIQLVKFGTVGGSGYAINLAVFAVLAGALGAHHLLAAVGAFCVAVSSNFFWNRHWTFAAGSGRTGFQAPRFFAVSIVGLAINLVLLEALVSAGVPELLSQAIAVALSMPVNFVGNKLWTFGAQAS